MKEKLKHTRFWQRLLASVLTACMLLGLAPGIPGLVFTARAQDGGSAAADGTKKDAYGFDLSEPSSFDKTSTSNPYGSAAVDSWVNFNPVKELGIYESAANHQISMALNLDRKNKYFFDLIEMSNFDFVLSTAGGDDHYDRHESNLTGTLSGSGGHSYYQHGYCSRLQYVRGVAYDPTGSGRDDHIVYYGFGNNRDGKAGTGNTNRPGFVGIDATEGGSADNGINWQGSGSGSGDDLRYAWMDAMSSFKSDGYNALAAGDFDGDGEDTLVVYNPAFGALSLDEYSGGSTPVPTHKNISIGSDGTLAGYFGGVTLNSLQTMRNKEGTDPIKLPSGDPNSDTYRIELILYKAQSDMICKNTAMVHLAAGNVDGDEADELIVTVSLGNLAGGREQAIGNNFYEDGKGSNASVVLVYDRTDSGWSLAYSVQLANVYDASKLPSDKDGGYQGWFMRSAASAMGNIDDDPYPEIVTVGLPSDDKRHDEDDISSDGLLFTIIDCDGKGGYSVKTTSNPVADDKDKEDHPKTIPLGYWVSNRNGDKFGDWADPQTGYADNPPLSIGCVQLEGVGTKHYVFARGHIFQFGQDNGRDTFVPATNQGDTGSDKNTDRYLQDMKYISQPVIGNFDGNEQGRQQVFFVVGTRGGNDSNWIAGLAYDPKPDSAGAPTRNVMDGTGLYSCDWNTDVINRDTRYSASVVLTAPDVDRDDGMLAQFESKEYTYSEPEIMAIMEASPYFEDLVELYPETAGVTTFGTGKSSGTGSSESASTRAGTYVGFEQDFDLFGVTLGSVEMEASFEAEWSSETAQETVHTYEMTYEIGRDHNQVLLIRTPVIIYRYKVKVPTSGPEEDDYEIMTVTEPQQPAYYLMPIDRYNELARQLDDPVIGSDILSSIPGQPDTYRTSDTGLENVQIYPSWGSVGGGSNNTMTQAISKESSTSVTTSLTHSIDAKVGAGAGGFVLGVSGGGSETKAQSVTDTKSISRSGTVASIPKDYVNDYEFSWRFMTWTVEIDGYTVPVLGYQVKDVKQPPSLPRNLEATPEATSIILTWNAGFNSAEKYEIFRYLPGDQSYTRMATVLGSAGGEDGSYEYELTGLTPGFTYYYALRAVSGGVESAYTEPLMVVTASQDGDLPVIFEQPAGVSVRPGESAEFTVGAYAIGTQESYNWQVRRAGRLAWEPIHNATESKLTLANATEDMDGNQYRCQVSTVSNSSETRVFLYSDPATLSVGKSGSITTVTAQTAEGKNGGTVGYASDGKITQEVTKVYQVTTPQGTGSYHAYSAGGSSYYYCVDDGTYYLLNGFDGGDAAVEGRPGVYAASAESRTALTGLQDVLVLEETQSGEGGQTTVWKWIARLGALHSAVQEKETIGGTEYHVFTAQGVAVAEKDGVPVRELIKTDLTLYQKAGDEGEKAFYANVNEGRYDEASGNPLPAELKQLAAAGADTELKNLTYDAETLEAVWSDEPGAETAGDVTYAVYSDGTTTVYQDGSGAYYCKELVPSTPPAEGEGSTEPVYEFKKLTRIAETEAVTPLAVVGADGVIASRIDHPTAARAETVVAEIPTTTAEPGVPVTLTARVNNGAGEVVFKIVNTTTGASQSMTGELQGGTAAVTWTPAAPGVYKITAFYQGDGSTLPSASELPAIYYAYAEPTATTGYKLGLDERISYGAPVTPELVMWAEENGEVREETLNIGGLAVSAYAFLGIGTADGDGVPLADANGYSLTAVEGWEPGETLIPGDYLIKAEWGTEESGSTASALLTVAKRELTIAAPESSKLSLDEAKAFDLTERLKEITVTPGFVAGDEEAYGGQATGYANLFRLTGGPQASAGRYDLRVDYANKASQPTPAQERAYTDFMSKYVAVFKERVVSVEDDLVAVHYEAGANGSLTATANGASFASGDSVSIGSNLRFIAIPNDSTFAVSRWTINGADITQDNAAAWGAELHRDSKGNEILTVEGVNRELTVDVEFSNRKYAVNFSAAPADWGTVTAATIGGPISTGANVVGGRPVTFTAVPNEGYVIQKWTVNGVEQKNDDGSRYAGKTFTLENLSAAANVAVTFEAFEEFTVTFEAVDEKGNDLSAGIALSTQGLTDGKAAKGSSVTLKAEPDVGNAVQEWQIGKDGDWVRVADSQQSYTIRNLQGDTHIRVVVSTNAVTYSVSFGVYDERDLDNAITGGGVLTAFINGKEISNGSSQPNNSRVDFTFAETEAYEFVKWVVNRQEVQDSGKTYVLDGLTGNAAVKAVVKEKPQVTVTQPENGGVTVTAGGEPLNSGDYVYNGTDLTFTVAPEKGYRVKSWTVNGRPTPAGDPAGTDDQSFTVRAEGGQDVRVTVELEEIPAYTVAYSVVDVNGQEPGGENGGLTASADRKGMEDYLLEKLDSGTEVHQGSTLTFTAAPEADYRVKEWTVNGEVYMSGGLTFTGNVLTLENLGAEAVVAVQFVLLGDRITVAAGDGGSIASAWAGGVDQIGNISTGFQLAENASVTITVTPNAGYEVKAWTVNGETVPGESGTEYTYTSRAEGVGADIQVSFQQAAYPVAWGGSHGTVTAAGYDGGSADIRGGTEVVFTAQPDGGYTVAGWTVNGEAVSDETGGTFTWEVPNGQAENPPVEDYVIQAVFQRGSYPFAMTQPEHGTLTADRTESEVVGGTAVTFTAAPEKGYLVVGWTVNGVTTESLSNTHTVVIEDAVTVAVVLVPDHYNVEFRAAGAGGSLSAQGYDVSPASVPYGGDVTFTAAPDPHYHVTGWQVDGAPVTEGVSADKTTLTLSNVTAAHSVTVTFGGAVRYEVSYSVAGQTGGALSAKVNGEELTLAPGQTEWVQGGSTLVFTAVPADGRMAARWIVNGEPVTRENMTELGVRMEHYLSSTLTAPGLGGELDIQVEFEEEQVYDIPAGQGSYTVTALERLPDTPGRDTQIRRGGDVTFKVGAAAGKGYVMLSSLTVNGYDCLTGEGEPTGCEAVAAEQNADGSCTVSITGVSGPIDLDAEARRLVVSPGLDGYVIPEALKTAGFDTPDKIRNQLKAQLTSVSGGTAYYDIALMYWDEDAEAWREIPEAAFPEEGVDVTLPYPTGSDSRDAFTVVHMLAAEKGDQKPGDTEIVRDCAKTGAGLFFHVDSLSPFAVGWSKYTVPIPGGGESYKIILEEAAHGVVKADKDTAGEGDKVLLTVRPDDGYELDTLTVTGRWGEEVDIIRETDGYAFLMPAEAVTVQAVFREEAPWVNPFTDVAEGAWYYSAVQYVHENGLMAGTGSTTFSPNAATTRGMIVTILYRLEGSPSLEGEIWGYPYADVDAGSWYGTAVYWARLNGIVNGYSDELFGPNDAITREQMAAILYRYARYKGYDTTATADLSKYTDAAQIGSWAMDAMEWANAVGLVNGTGAATLSPKGSAARAQAAAILTRFCRNVK